MPLPVLQLRDFDRPYNQPFSPMLLTIKLFAVARQRAGRDSIEVELPESATVGDLRAAVARQHPPLAELLTHVRFAVNSDYAADSSAIPSGAEVACIPPVSGG